ncbi:hypothetical protein M2475_002149 [Breznakia sp. PF5-3]|nr:hypothetical protein [Breznakia sp. PM6-1]MDF9836568.1 hypothetical protein [Breznakia sp. PF5-3]MDF9838786.1 hypothetical protein [Breznakia sp. PFB2-8]MDF9860800.1 hypothetical protein [Breznakia sp. PH5-24]
MYDNIYDILIDLNDDNVTFGEAMIIFIILANENFINLYCN